MHVLCILHEAQNEAHLAAARDTLIALGDCHKSWPEIKHTKRAGRQACIAETHHRSGAHHHWSSPKSH